jgi:predicted AAA+ superfamily ATPase
MIVRQMEQVIPRYMHKKRAIIIYGARRTGKTTLMQALSKDMSNLLTVNGDFSNSHDLLNVKSEKDVHIRFGKYDYLLVDEAQRIANIGLKLKSIIDTLPNLQVIATGSSSLDLSNSTVEPLTGRKFEFVLSPLSTAELHTYGGITEVMSSLSNRLIYGNYPEVLLSVENTEDILMETAGSYLFRDVLNYQAVKRPDMMKKLLKAIALQLGCQVSYSELASIVGLDAKTVERYIYLMEQSFILFKVGSYSRNVRNELKRSNKIYFWDNGIRNAMINDFKPLEDRLDIGSLWENYFISERRKYMHNNMHHGFEHYFWRTTQKQEIDLIEVTGQDLHAFELKWNPNKNPTIPRTFTQSYPEAKIDIVNRNNYLPLLIDFNNEEE